MDQKKGISITSDLKPFIVDTKKAVLMINQFEMIPPSKEAYNAFDLKFLRSDKPTEDMTQFLARRS